MPGGVGGVVRGDDALLLGVYQGEVRDADHSPARIAPRVAKGVKLFEVDILDADLFFEFTRRGAFERFVNFDKPAGQGPPVLEWLLLATDQQHPEVVFGNREDYQINGH